MSNARLSKKQQQFLNAILKHPSGCLYWGHIPEDVWYSFRTEGAVERWIKNMEERGLIRIENRHFYRLTDFGKSTITQPHPRRSVKMSKGNYSQSAICPGCNKCVRVVIPKGGDGSAYVYMRHKGADGKPCRFNRLEVKQKAQQ